MCIASFSISCSLLGAQSTMEKKFLLAILNPNLPGIASNADKYVSSYPCSDAHERASRDVG